MRRLLVSVVLAAFVMGLTAGPSAAQTKVRKDPVGDVPARVDLTSLKVQDNGERFAVTARVRRVLPGRTAVLLDLYPRRGPSYFLYSLPTGKRTYMVQLRVLRDGDDRDRAVDCPGLSVRWDQGRSGHARFVVPQRCIAERGAIMQTSVMTLDTDQLDRGRLGDLLRRGDADDDTLISDGLGPNGFSAVSTRQG